MFGPFAWSKVLIVDDNDTNLLLTQKLMLHAGLHTVTTLNDSRSVLDWVDANDPDLVLLDLHMPHLDGYALLEALRERANTTELPIVVLTADSRREASLRALDLGANDFLVKPLEASELLHRIRNLLDMRHAHRALRQRHRWLEAADQFSRGLFAEAIEDPLGTLAYLARDIAEADEAAILERGGGDPPTATTQQLSPELRARLGDVPILLGPEETQACLGVVPLPHADGRPALGPGGTALLLPLRGTETWHGVLCLRRGSEREPFGGEDLEAAHLFTSRAATALELLERRSEQKRYLDFFEVLVSQVTDYAILRLDLDGTIASWNRGAERVQGSTVEEAVGEPFGTLFVPEDVEAELPGQLLVEARREGRATRRVWGRRRRGNPYWAEVLVTALEDEHSRLIGYAAVIRDMTETRQLEQIRETFFASLSHDIRAPLTAARGFLEMIPESAGEERALFYERVGSNLARLDDLIQNFIEGARTQAGTALLDLGPIDPGPVLSDCIRDLAPTLGEHRIEVDADPVLVFADRHALDRILTNLLLNAAKYSAPATPIRVAVREVEGRAEIRVSDRGRGIQPQDLPTIFESFERGSMAQPDGGMGLGLSSVRLLAELQGGGVRIESEPGAGTSVTVTLSLARTPRE